jgi:hypothetical protein
LLHAAGEVESHSKERAVVAGLPLAGVVRAPDFPSGLDWINVPRPLSLADLRGKVVLLDFWTYG